MGLNSPYFVSSYFLVTARIRKHFFISLSLIAYMRPEFEKNLRPLCYKHTIKSLAADWRNIYIFDAFSLCDAGRQV